MKKTFGFYAFLFLLSFVVAALTEETLKYYLIRRVRTYRPEFADWKGYLYFGVAAGLGFSTIENIGYVIQTGFAEGDVLTKLIAILIVSLERMAVSTPLHLMVAYIQALGFIDKNVLNRPKNYFTIILPAVTFHGAFDFFLFLIQTSEWADWQKMLGSFLVSVATLVLLATFIFYRRKTTLPQEINQPGLLPVVQPRDPNAYVAIDREESQSHNEAYLPPTLPQTIN